MSKEVEYKVGDLVTVLTWEKMTEKYPDKLNVEDWEEDMLVFDSLHLSRKCIEHLKFNSQGFATVIAIDDDGTIGLDFLPLPEEADCVTEDCDVEEEEDDEEDDYVRALWVPISSVTKINTKRRT